MGLSVCGNCARQGIPLACPEMTEEPTRAVGRAMESHFENQNHTPGIHVPERGCSEPRHEPAVSGLTPVANPFLPDSAARAASPAPATCFPQH